MPDANSLVTAFYVVGSTLLGVWGFIKVVKDVKKTNDDEVKRQERIENMVKIVEENHDKWDQGLLDIYSERSQIVKQYNERLDEQDAKIQDLLSMLIMIMQAQDAILEALIEQGIGNGEIKETRKALHKSISEQLGK